MHARHRSPGNGYRSGSMGMGMAASRISPEGSVRGHGFYNSEYRSFNRGFGRGQGQLKSYQPPVPMPRKGGGSGSIGGGGGGCGDIFLEAGRLAAEYLVSQGLLPPSAVSGKWQNGSAKGFRSQDGEEGRNSALSRLGNYGSDGRRRYSDYARGKRRGGSFRGDLREYGRNLSWSDRGRVSPDMEGDDDNVSGHYEEQLAGKDVGNGSQSSVSGEIAPKSEETGYAEVELEKSQFSDDLGSKASSSGAGKDLSHGTNGESSKRSDDSTNMNAGTVEMKDDSTNNETEKKDVIDDSTVEQCDVETDPSSNIGTDLITLLKFAKFPTKTRTSMAYRGSKVDSLPNNKEENNPDCGSQNKTEDLAEDISLDSSSGKGLSNKTHDSGLCSNAELSKAVPGHSAETVEELGSSYGLEQGKWTRSQSFPNSALMHESVQELGQSLLALQRSSTMGTVRSEKRAIEESDMREGIKKPREWLQPSVTKAEDFLHPANLSEKRVGSPEEIASSVENVAVAVPTKGLVCNPQFPSAGGETCVEYAQEKQLFPSSFKICDLNLMEGSDMNENPHSDMMLINHSITETKKEPAQVDIDLSISNSNISGEPSRLMSTDKGIEVIDLENDSTQEEKTIDNLEKRTETMFTSLDGFSNHAQNPGPIPDVQDHYDGLMITEYLNAFSNSPTAPEDINPLQNEMGLPHGEGTLADDDAIYMSLGEIPLSFLPAWEHPPPREYEKPF